MRVAILLVLVSLLVTAVCWLLGFPLFFLFLFFPLLLVGSRKVRRCPACGWETRGDENFCPVCGTCLESPGTSDKV